MKLAVKQAIETDCTGPPLVVPTYGYSTLLAVPNTGLFLFASLFVGANASPFRARDCTRPKKM